MKILIIWIFLILILVGIFSIGFTANEDFFIVKYSSSIGVIISGLVLFFMFKNKIIFKRIPYLGLMIFLLIFFSFLFSFIIFNRGIPFLLHKTNFSQEVILECKIQEKLIHKNQKCIELSNIKINKLQYCFSNYERNIYNDIKIGDKIFVSGKISKYGINNLRIIK